MRVAVLGGTGVVGRHVVAALTARGDEPVVVARSTGVDVVTGQGLDGALAGAAAVVDATNVTTFRRRPAVRFFTAAARTVQSAAARAGVGHLVVLSIVGVDRAPGFGYYQGKLAHEREATRGPVPATVLRATQFHEFAGQIVRRTRLGPVAVVPRMRCQPVSAQAVGAELARLAATEPSGALAEVAGPEQHDLPDLARRWLRHRGQRITVLALRLPGASGRAQAGGGLLPGPDALVTGPTFQQWLDAGERG